MSITDLIVELIEQGKQVEIEGVGTMGSAEREAHLDEATHTFWPASRMVAFSPETTGETSSIVKVLSERECVSDDVARQMWRNYVDALTDKLQRTGSHVFGSLGTLMRNADGSYDFAAAGDATLGNTNENELPITDVKTYSHEGEPDPFAQYEPTPEVEQQTAEPQAAVAKPVIEEAVAEAAADVVSEVVAEAEAAVVVEDVPEPKSKANIEAVAAEAEAIAALAAATQLEQEAKAENVNEEMPAVEEEPAATVAEQVEAAPVVEQKIETPVVEQKIETLAETKSEKKKEEKKEKEDKGETVLPFPESFDKAAETKSDDGEGKRKKKKHWWLWVLLLLLLLLAAGAAYYYLNYMHPKQPVSAASEEREVRATNWVDGVNSLTYNADLIEYGRRDMRRHSELVNQTMAEYVENYLAERNYRSARVPMMDRIRQYSATRIEELLGPRFAVQRLIPYDDYIYHYCEPYIKERNAKSARCTVQRELMQREVMDRTLDQIVSELGLQPDAATERSAEAVQEVKQAEKQALARNTEDKEANVYVERGSRQGFDLIAGFYLNKATAAVMSGRLHSLGCDAYIIQFNDLYYVSMGSASSQTAADALLKHVKSWYDGDVVIKKW